MAHTQFKRWLALVYATLTVVAPRVTKAFGSAPVAVAVPAKTANRT